jgi:hypothetical protein
MASLRHEAQKLVPQIMKQGCQILLHKTWCYLRRNGDNYRTRNFKIQLSVVCCYNQEMDHFVT